MTNAFCGILERYGEETKISWDGGSAAAKTFIQPVISPSSGDGAVMTPLGRADKRTYYWFAPAYLELDTEKEITVTSGESKFRLVRAEKFRAMGRVSHWEGLLTERRSVSDDGV